MVHVSVILGWGGRAKRIARAHELASLVHIASYRNCQETLTDYT